MLFGKLLESTLWIIEADHLADRPLGSGFLTGKFTAGEHSDTRFGDDHPHGKVMQGIFGHEELHSAVRTLEGAAKRFDVSLREAALRWIFYHSALNENDSVILGATNIQQIEENIISIEEGPLPQELADVFDEVWPTVEPMRGSIV